MQLLYLTQNMRLTDGGGERVQVIGRSVSYLPPPSLPSPGFYLKLVWCMSDRGYAAQKDAQ